jgi:hypothetical protein
MEIPAENPSTQRGVHSIDDRLDLQGLDGHDRFCVIYPKRGDDVVGERGTAS